MKGKRIYFYLKNQEKMEQYSGVISSDPIVKRVGQHEEIFYQVSVDDNKNSDLVPSGVNIFEVNAKLIPDTL
jgi:hypothetical protein